MTADLDAFLGEIDPRVRDQLQRCTLCCISARVCEHSTRDWSGMFDVAVAMQAHANARLQSMEFWEDYREGPWCWCRTLHDWMTKYPQLVRNPEEHFLDCPMVNPNMYNGGA